MVRKAHFNLFAIFEWTAALAFLCALLAGSGSRATGTTDFATLPPDDAKLLRWLEAEGRSDVKVRREGNSVTLSAQAGVVAGIVQPFRLLPDPPWGDFGYGTIQGTMEFTQWTLFHGSLYVWIIGFGILIVLGWVRRRCIKPIEDSTADGAAS